MKTIVIHCGSFLLTSITNDKIWKSIQKSCIGFSRSQYIGVSVKPLKRGNPDATTRKVQLVGFCHLRKTTLSFNAYGIVVKNKREIITQHIWTCFTFLQPFFLFSHLFIKVPRKIEEYKWENCGQNVVTEQKSSPKSHNFQGFSGFCNHSYSISSNESAVGYFESTETELADKLLRRLDMCFFEYGLTLEENTP